MINELSILFNKLDLDTEEVLNAAETKWNFLPFRPGLVGGHCIGVDPYYLTYKARSIGYEPKTILAGRAINNYMPQFVTDNLLQLIKKIIFLRNGKKHQQSLRESIFEKKVLGGFKMSAPLPAGVFYYNKNRGLHQSTRCLRYTKQWQRTQYHKRKSIFSKINRPREYPF